MKAEMKKKTKKKTKKKKSTTEDLYDEFMKAVQKAEDAKTEKTRVKWLKSAEKTYKALLKKEDDLSSPQLRRAKRTKEFLDELEAESKG